MSEMSHLFLNKQPSFYSFKSKVKYNALKCATVEHILVSEGYKPMRSTARDKNGGSCGQGLQEAKQPTLGRGRFLMKERRIIAGYKKAPELPGPRPKPAELSFIVISFHRQK